jgi:SnoaL-like domain
MALPSPAEAEDKRLIRELIENWVVWRDAGHWERFRTVWHDDGVMMATWFQGPFAEFIRVSQEGWDRGVSILHFLGGTSIDLAGARAVAQTKMTISQRGLVEGELADIVCTGRFYDFLEKRRIDGQERLGQDRLGQDRLGQERLGQDRLGQDRWGQDRWGLVLRQPIYEKDTVSPVDPAARIVLDKALLARFPAGYRHLAYVQTQIGYTVKPDMPGLKGPEVEALYARGAAWLAG